MVKTAYVNTFDTAIVEVCHGGFWNYREYLRNKNLGRTDIYNSYLDKNAASIGVLSSFATKPTLPHGLHGIHISDGAQIGANVTIFQNVTIGSNTLKNTKKAGAPKIGNNVYIGANATIIGGITIGDNCRVGANCCVYCDIPDNHTVVAGGGLRIIEHAGPVDNTFYYL